MEEIEEKYKYECEKCNYKCNFECEWKKHCETTLHKTGKRKKKDNYVKPEKCKLCDYTHKNKVSLRSHFLNKHSTLEERKKEYKYYCETCDFGSFFDVIIKNHNSTEKHKINLLRKGIQ